MSSIQQALEDAVSDYDGPLQLYDLDRIGANIRALGRALGSVDRILFPVKSFPAPEVIRVAFQAGAGFEVSSEHEYALLPDDLGGVTVSLNAPDSRGPERYLERGNELHVHLDSPAPAETLPTAADMQLALRLSHTALELPDVPVGRTSVSRFGVTLDAWIASAPLFRDGRLRGVHIHNGSEANTAAFYRSVLALILLTAAEHDMPLSFVNLGGGFHAVEMAELEPLVAELSATAGTTPVYVEPGRVLSRGAGYLVARVVGIHETGQDRFNVTVDASHDCHAQWARLEWTMAEELDAERCESFSTPSLGPEQMGLHFTGSTCAERDVMGVYRLPRQAELPVAVGDVITFANLPGYAYAWNTSFNGVPPAEVRFVS